MAELQFIEYRDKILKALEAKRLKGDLRFNENVTLLDGFIMLDLRQGFGAGVQLGGPQVPSVGLLGEKTGQLYLLPIKTLLPEIQL